MVLGVREKISNTEFIMEEKESLKMRVKEYLEDLRVVNEFFLDKNFDLSWVGVEEFNNSTKKDFFSSIESVLNIIRRIKNIPDLKQFMNHDLSNITMSVFSSLMGSLDILKMKTLSERDIYDLEICLSSIKEVWSRFFVSISDILLRFAEKERIEIELSKDFDLHTFDSVLKYFSRKEKQRLIDESKNLEDAEHRGLDLKEIGKINHYKGLKNREFNNSFNFDDVSKFLDGRKIKGNTEIITNFILNSLRNSFKHAIEVSGEHTEIYLDVFVEDDDLVIRIEDTGKGMNFSHLDPKSPDFIFTKGSSSTGSSGLGITDFHTRLLAMGGEIMVFSKRVGQKDFEYYSNGSGMPGKVITFHNHDEVGHMFNQANDNDFARKVKEKGHGTVISLYLPLVA